MTKNETPKMQPVFLEILKKEFLQEYSIDPTLTVFVFLAGYRQYPWPKSRDYALKLAPKVGQSTGPMTEELGEEASSIRKAFFDQLDNEWSDRRSA